MNDPTSSESDPGLELSPFGKFFLGMIGVLLVVFIVFLVFWLQNEKLRSKQLKSQHHPAHVSRVFCL